MIIYFTKAYDFLRLEYPVKIVYCGDWYPSALHLFEALKMDTLKMRARVREARTANDIFMISRKPDIPVWDLKRASMEMLKVQRVKFTQVLDLRYRLLDTGATPIVYANSVHDNLLGACKCVDCKDVEKHDLVGSSIMAVRASFAGEPRPERVKVS